MTPEQAARLPKWAAREIAWRDREIERLKDRLAERDGVFAEWKGDAVVFADPYEDHPRPVATAHDEVRFCIGPGPDDWLDVSVSVRDAQVEVRSWRTLVLSPRSSNVFRVGIVE